MQDNEFYDVVAQELLEAKIQAGVWTRAFSEADGDKEKAKAIYIRLRVAELAQDEQAQIRDRETARRDAKSVERARKRAKIGWQLFEVVVFVATFIFIILCLALIAACFL